MKVTQARFNHLEVELGKRNLIISTLNEQNTALQKQFAEFERVIAKLEQDGKLLNWMEENWCDKVKNKFKEDILVVGGVEARGTDLRQVLTKAMARAEG